jgi:WhiB family redox-sensing transcriptional regulator
MASSSRSIGPAIDRELLPRPTTDGWGWQLSARCRGLPSEVFFPEEEESRRQRRLREAAAKQICAACPVMSACREHALRAPEKYGVWGALTARERFSRW